MRKAIALVALIVGIVGFGTSGAGTRTCDEHGGVTAATGFKVGTMQDRGRDSLDVCSDSGAPYDGVVRAGESPESAYVAVDGSSDVNDGYVYANLDGDGASVYCAQSGDYDRPAGRAAYDPARDAARADRCA